MKDRRKKILAIVLILVVLLLAAAAIFVTIQLQKAPVPTAPPRPEAAQYIGGGACTINFTIPTAGQPSCTQKAAYRNASGNTAGNYSMSANLLIGAGKVTAGERVVFAIGYKNDGGTATTITATDVLDAKLDFVDAATGCVFNSTTRTVTCTKTDVAPGASGTFAFRVAVRGGSTGNIANSASVNGASCSTTLSIAAASVSCVAKETYKDKAGNTAGSYTLDQLTDIVSQNETFVYSIRVKNDGDATASGVTVSDVLTGENQNLLTFVDASSGCTYSSANKTVSCNIANVGAGQEVRRSFRVKVAASATNGQTIKNSAKVSFGGTDTTCAKDVVISGVVSCDNTCTTDGECSSGLVCSGGKCRNQACTEEADCVCPTVTATPTETPTGTTTTTAPTTVTETVTGTVTATTAPTTVTEAGTVAATATPTAGLPEAGVFNLPGAAAFAGGLLLTILGILFAL